MYLEDVDSDFHCGAFFGGKFAVAINIFASKFRLSVTPHLQEAPQLNELRQRPLTDAPHFRFMQKQTKSRDQHAEITNCPSKYLPDSD